MGREVKIAAIAAITIALIGTSGVIGYRWAQQKSMTTTTAHDDAQRDSDSRKVLYWYDPMVPNQHFDKPGKSPFMDMQLVPRYADEGADRKNASAGIRVDAATRQNLGVRTAAVERRAFDNAITVAGTIDFNAREIAVVQARTNGFVSRVYARAAGDVIARGAPLADVTVPEWTGAQQEFIALRSSGDAALAAAARERLLLLGMPAEVVRRIERSGQPQTTATIAAPIAGVIQTLDVRAGMTIATGATFAQINSLQTVWLTAAVPETLSGTIDVGDSITATVPALNAAQIAGRVIAVLPQTDAATRTLAVRAELKNADGRLRPGQYAQVQLHAAPAENALVVPSEAIIRSGTRTVIIVADRDRFIPTLVQTGRENDGFTEIRDGVREGQRVVVSGQFLIDSEANLTGALTRMNDDANPARGDHP